MGAGRPQAEVQMACDEVARVGARVLAMVLMRMVVLGPVRVPGHVLVHGLVAVVGVDRFGMRVTQHRAIREDVLVYVVVAMGVIRLVAMQVRVHGAVCVTTFVLGRCLVFEALLVRTAATGRAHRCPLLVLRFWTQTIASILTHINRERGYSTSISFTRISVPAVT
jgi:hypothetical protein